MLISASNSTHISTQYTGASVYNVFVEICSPAETQYGGFMHLPRSHRAICLLFVHRNANVSIYPALPACPLRSLCSSHQRYLALFY